MNSRLKVAITVVFATAGLVGCADVEGGAGGDVSGAGDVGGGVSGGGGATGDIVDLVAGDVKAAAQTFTPAQCSTRIINRGNETATKALVGDLVSVTDLTTGARGDYTKNASIYCNGANGDTKIVLGLIRAKYQGLGAQNFLGYPTSDELPNQFNTGRFNVFTSGGVVLWKNGAPEAFEVHGAIRGLFATMGSEFGEMGFALSDETSLSGSRKRNIFEFGRLYWTNSSLGAWPVLTTSGGNPSDRLAQLSLPRVTTASMRADQTGGGCLSISGAGFTAGQTVEFRITNPDRVAEIAGSASVRSDGTFSFTDVAPLCSDRTVIKKVNGIVTVHVFERGTGKSAVGGFFTSAGTDFVGTM